LLIYCVFAALFLATQRFLRAATIAALPAAESFRFAGFDVFSDLGLAAAHLFRWASPMRFRAAADILRLPGLGDDVAAEAAGPPFSI